MRSRGGRGTAQPLPEQRSHRLRSSERSPNPLRLGTKNIPAAQSSFPSRGCVIRPCYLRGPDSIPAEGGRGTRRDRTQGRATAPRSPTPLHLLSLCPASSDPNPYRRGGTHSSGCSGGFWEVPQTRGPTGARARALSVQVPPQRIPLRGTELSGQPLTNQPGCRGISTGSRGLWGGVFRVRLRGEQRCSARSTHGLRCGTGRRGEGGGTALPDLSHPTPPSSPRRLAAGTYRAAAGCGCEPRSPTCGLCCCCRAGSDRGRRGSPLAHAALRGGAGRCAGRRRRARPRRAGTGSGETPPGTPEMRMGMLG